jgi:hypothetical protein
MIISTIEKDIEAKSRAVFFTDDGVITKISSLSEKEANLNFAWFALKDVLPFLDGVYKFSDYIVTKTKNPLIHEIKKKSVDFKQRSADRLIHKISTCNDSEIVIKLDNTSIKIMASDGVLNEFDVNVNNDVKISGYETHIFYVTLKDNPDFVLQTIEVPFNKLLSGEVIETECVKETSSVSLYTKRVFNSYSLE